MPHAPRQEYALQNVTIGGKHHLLLAAGELLESDTGRGIYTTTPDGEPVEGVLTAVDRDGPRVTLHLQDAIRVQVLAAKQVALAVGPVG